MYSVLQLLFSLKYLSRLLYTSQRPSPRMQGWVVTTWCISNLCFLSLSLSHTLSLSLSYTLFSQRCCAEGHAGKVPFPSISGRLQRSVIREINGTGPISCLVPFESAKLLRTSKKMNQFICDCIVLNVQKVKTHTAKPQLQCAHSHTHTYTLWGSSFLAQEKHKSKYDIINGKNELSVDDIMVWMVPLCSAVQPPSCVWFNTHTLEYWPAGLLDDYLYCHYGFCQLCGGGGDFDGLERIFSQIFLQRRCLKGASQLGFEDQTGFNKSPSVSNEKKLLAASSETWPHLCLCWIHLH